MNVTTGQYEDNFTLRANKSSGLGVAPPWNSPGNWLMNPPMDGIPSVEAGSIVAMPQYVTVEGNEVVDSYSLVVGLARPVAEWSM